MYCVDYTVFIEDDDQCLTCENYARGVACPLLEALGQGVVYLEDSLIVTNCGFFKEFKRTLHVVKKEVPDEDNNITDDNEEDDNNE